ncbi:calcineurin-like metallo-phosphoesterase super family protein [Striga asiatica]|uniref:Calcineurin-like metallo-phosphoesterase super family protein n=1 Tax=Striga asiatica TaxID=4170 RepID=A0A5A7R0T7_STRAF|nr:calcineurin-like metallo-phosphoesterase super family protein [Striga asiatica]
MGEAAIAITIFLALCAIQSQQSASLPSDENQSRRGQSNSWSEGSKKRELIEIGGGPDDDLVWVVQLSDLHFSVHHPERAADFTELVGPTLSFIKPDLVLLTGDLTDGKSKDLLTMKQDEDEWIEYDKVMRDVVKRSGLDKSKFYDVRGNHDNFGVPSVGGPFDFFSKYSINQQLERSGKVNSITFQTSKRKILFVGFDSTMSLGLRGPTNLFGHPTDELLGDINSELVQWDSQPSQPVTKISFGHFPLSFSAASKSGKTLNDIFIKNSLSVYLCGHLHVKFGKNLKRYHHSQYSKRLFQLKGHRTTSNIISTQSNEFWEWETGDWRKNRVMRILAIDRGHISFVDTDFKLGAKRTIILPTFPLDSRFTSSTLRNYYEICKADIYSCGFIRALVFSSSPIVSVYAKIYDSSTENLVVVLESPMTKLGGLRGDIYIAPWNIRAFEDPSPERFLLRIEAIDIRNRSTFSKIRPFSVNGVPLRFSWSWKEFFVMGCQWDSLYFPILSVFYFLTLSVLVIPKVVLSFFSRRQYTFRNFRSNKRFMNGLAWIFMELYDIQLAWLSIVGYLFYLVLCPWFYGQISTRGVEKAYMTYKGWVSRFDNSGKIEFFGFPDVMVIVLAHLFLVVLPSIIISMAFAAESGIYRDHLMSRSSKKKDDDDDKTSEIVVLRRWFRKLLYMASLAIVWKHFKNCVALMKAFEMNPIVDFPVYSFAVPFLLAYTILKTRRRNLNGSQEK